MPKRRRFFFIVQGPKQSYDDEAGTLLFDDKSACVHAETLIEELKNDGEYDFRDWMMIVQNDDGHTIFSIPFFAA